MKNHEEHQKIIDAWNADMRASNDDEKTLRAGKRIARKYEVLCFVFWLGVALIILSLL